MKRFNSDTHESPRYGRAVGANLDLLAAVSRSFVAMALQQEPNGSGFYEDSYGATDDILKANPLMVSLFGAVSQSIGVEFQGRVMARVVTDPQLIQKGVDASPGSPINTYHTDFDILLSNARRAELIRPGGFRYLYVTGGEGPRMVSAPIDTKAYTKLTDLPFPKTINLAEFEACLDIISTGIIGYNNQFVRAPRDRAQFEDMHSIENAPEDCWLVPHPDTVHAIPRPEDLDIGRLTLTTIKSNC